MSARKRTDTVLGELADERARQDATWGEQNHPDGTDPGDRHMAETMKHRCQEAAAAGLVTWRHILMEEVFEAIAESDPERLRSELVQVAAVSVAWVEAIDRREATR